jgi:hypothetical protein
MVAAPVALIFADFSLDGSFLLLSTECYFAIYSIPSRSLVLQEHHYGGLRWLHSLGSSSVFLLVPSGDKPGIDNSPRRPKFWNAQNRTCIQDLVFETSVEACDWNLSFAIFLTERNVHIYDIEQMQITSTLPRCTRSKAMALSPSSDLLFYASPDTGSVCMYSCHEKRILSHNKVHRSELAQITVNQESNMLATVSQTGTIIRVFTIPSNELLYSYRISQVPISIIMLRFCHGFEYLLCQSSCGDLSWCAIGHASFGSSLSHGKEENTTVYEETGDVDDADYCRINTVEVNNPKSRDFTSIFSELWKSELAQSIVDTGLHTMSTLHSYSQSMISGKVGGLDKLEADHKLLRPVLQVSQGEELAAATIMFNETHEPYLYTITNGGLFRRYVSSIITLN